MMEQSELKKEALSIVGELDLSAMLNRFGEAELVGSVALDLIVKLDIDIHLLIEEENLFSTVDQITHYLLDQQKVREVRITDWREEGGIKIGVDAYPGKSGMWSIDIWVTNQIESTAFGLMEVLKSQLNRAHRQHILEIKQYYQERGKLRDGLSLKIYQAVLNEGVRTVGEFEEYLINA